jgi:GTP-binding protein
MNAHAKAETAAAKVALAWAHTARFLVTASRLDQLPPPGLPEIAFVGRSNAGKSSAINALAQHKRLAFSSRTPGRTQHINLFEIGPRDAPDALFADLPGYGYAAVERGAKLRWQRVMAEYLQARESLAGVVLLADSRLGLTELDERLLNLIAPRLEPKAEPDREPDRDGGRIRLLVLLTKADKLNRREAQQALKAIEAQLGAFATDEADISVGLFSALSRQGLGDAAEVLHGWRAPAAVESVDSVEAVAAVGSAA